MMHLIDSLINVVVISLFDFDLNYIAAEKTISAKKYSFIIM